MLGLYGMLECQLCCELLLLLNMAHMGSFVTVKKLWVVSTSL